MTALVTLVRQNTIPSPISNDLYLQIQLQYRYFRNTPTSESPPERPFESIADQGTTWGHPPRACEKPFEIDPVRDAVSRSPAQTGPAFQKWESFEKFRTSIFDHQRPFRCKMSAMVGNFVHKVRSSRVLEPLIGPKLIRKLWQFVSGQPNRRGAQLVWTCPQHDRTRPLSSLPLDLRTLLLPGLPLALPRGAGK